MSDKKNKNTMPLFVEIDKETKKQLVDKANETDGNVSNLIRTIFKGYFSRQRNKKST